MTILTTPSLSTVLLIVSATTAACLVVLVAVGGIVVWRNRDVVGDYIRVMPTTNLRIALTLLVFLATAGRYLALGVPDGNGWEAWLLFLVGMAGIDAAQFTAKRATVKPEMIAAGLTKESESRPRASGAATAVVQSPINVEVG